MNFKSKLKIWYQKMILPGSYWSTWILLVLLMIPATPDLRIRVCRPLDLPKLLLTGLKSGFLSSFSKYSLIEWLKFSGSPSSVLFKKLKLAIQEVDKNSSNLPKTTLDNLKKKEIN